MKPKILGVLTRWLSGWCGCQVWGECQVGVGVRWGMETRWVSVIFCEANDLKSADKVGVSWGGVRI